MLSSRPVDHQDVLEELAQTRAELKYVEGELQQFRLKEVSMRHQMNAAFDEVENTREALGNKDKFIAACHDEITKLMAETSDLRGSYEAVTRRAYRVNLANRTLKAQVEYLQSVEDAQVQEAKKNFSLDAFDNTLDQVSEAQVKSAGKVSIDGLNESINAVVFDVLEQASAIV